MRNSRHKRKFFPLKDSCLRQVYAIDLSPLSKRSHYNRLLFLVGWVHFLKLIISSISVLIHCNIIMPFNCQYISDTLSIAGSVFYFAGVILIRRQKYNVFLFLESTAPSFNPQIDKRHNISLLVFKYLNHALKNSFYTLYIFAVQCFSYPTVLGKNQLTL